MDLDRPTRDLSLGNRQKLGLVTALAHRPELVVLDESSNGLDPLMQREIETILRGLTLAGGTVLLSSALARRRRADRRSRRLHPGGPVGRAGAARRAGVPGASPAADGDARVVTVTWQGPAAPVLRRAADLGALTVDARGADLEATLLALYAEGNRQPEVVA